MDIDEEHLAAYVDSLIQSGLLSEDEAIEHALST